MVWACTQTIIHKANKTTNVVGSTSNITKLKNKKREPLSKFSFKWCHRDSNQGHKDFQSFSCYANQKQASDCNQLSYCTLQAVLLFYFCLILPWFNSWFTCGFTQIVITEKVLMYINICFYCLTTTCVLGTPLRIDVSPLGLHHILLELNPST